MGVRVEVIFFIALLGFSMYSIPAYAIHDRDTSRDKSAYLFKVTGFGGERWGGDIDNFVSDNNGVVHWAQWNWINDDDDKDAGSSNDELDCINGNPPFTRLPTESELRDWTKVRAQFTSNYHNYGAFPEFAPDHPAKLMMMGFSFGGAATIFTVNDSRNQDVPFDFVYTADPVGPNGNRINIIHNHGITHSSNPCVGNDDPKTLFTLESFPPCPTFRIINFISYDICKNTYANEKREIPPNVKYFLNRWQTGQDKDGDEIKLTKRIPPADNLRSPPIDGAFLTHPQVFSNQQKFNCNPNTTDGCHSDVAKETQNVVIGILNQMNNKPLISTPSQINIKEGSPAILKISATDNPTRWDKGMTVDFRMNPLEPTEKSALKLSRSGNSFSGVFLMGNLDGPSQLNKEIQAEDNGFPCGMCTDNGVNQIAAKGSKGAWDRNTFSIIVDNVPPTIKSTKHLFNGFETSLQMEISDPSTADMQAGFDYEIDWGDGNVDNFHDDSNSIISHPYKSGEYHITITTTDKDEGVSEPNGITLQTPFHNFSDNIDDLINDGTLNKGQGNSFNSKISQVISSFEKANNIPACNKAEAFINEVNGFINGEMFTAEQGQDLIEKAEAEIDKAGCNSENTFSFDLESNNEENNNYNSQKSNLRGNNSNEVKDWLNKARFLNVNTDSGSSNSQTSDIVTDDNSGSGGDEHLTRPTFGLSHETFETIVDSGFRFNDQSFTINDNHHTPFSQQTVKIGEVNSFEAKIYADKGLRVQEFLFGIPNVGEAHLAELGVEVWYDYNGEIEEVKVIQKSNVIDKETIVATHEKTKCQESDIEEKCNTTNVSMKFLEPLKDKVMAVKAIDYKNRYQITYLNEGVEIAGESLNPMNTFLIPSTVKGEGVIQVTQTVKYSPYWVAEDGRIFEMNSFGSFKQIDQSFERFQDTGNPYTRVHSGFGGIIAYEQKRATQLFDSSQFISELPESFAYVFPESGERVTEEMKAKMLEQEQIAKKVLEESKVQARW